MDYHKKFEFGYLFIAAICCIIVFFIAFNPRIYSLRIRNVPLNIEIHWKAFLFFTIISFVCISAIYLQKLTRKDIYQYSLKQ